MKFIKYILAVILIIVASTTFAQYPIPQGLGNNHNTLILTNSIKYKDGFINGVFPDTITANLSYIKSYPYAQIIANDTVYIRDSTATKWINRLLSYATISSLSTKLNVSDTSLMLLPYLTTVAAANIYYPLSNPNNYITLAGVPVQSVSGKTGTIILNKTDVGLENVDNTSDLSKPISTATQAAINSKLNISDTVTMLTNYAKNNVVALKLNISDTSNMLLHYAKNSALALKLNISDTTVMLLPYRSSFINESFDTTSRALTLTRIDGTSQSVVIPRGTASGTSGIGALSNSRTGNEVSVMGDNGTTTTFSINDADSATRVHLADVQTLTNKTLSGLNNTFTNIPESAVTNLVTDLNNKLDKSDSTLANRITALNNRTSNVDNTSDLSKPISTATQNALNLKADKATTLSGYGITDAVPATRTINGHVLTSNISLNYSDVSATRRAYNYAYPTYNEGSVFVNDDRYTNPKPRDIAKGIIFDFKQQDSIGLPATTHHYASVITMNPYSDISGSLSSTFRLAYWEGKLGFQGEKNDSTWTPWHNILTDSTFIADTDYLTPSGAASTYATIAALNLKANDNTVVHLTGDETIGGAKIFSSQVTVGDVLGTTFFNGSGLTMNRSAAYIKNAFAGGSTIFNTDILQFRDLTNTTTFLSFANTGVNISIPLSLSSINDATGDFVTRNSSTGLITKRTASEALSDMGGLSSSTAANTYFAGGFMEGTTLSNASLYKADSVSPKGGFVEWYSGSLTGGAVTNYGGLITFEGHANINNLQLQYSNSANSLYMRTKNNAGWNGWLQLEDRTHTASTYLPLTGGISSPLTGSLVFTPVAAGNRYILLNGDGTLTGNLTLQAGGGSAGYGGGLILHSHSNSTNPGGVTVGLSSGSTGKFTVNNQGLGGGTDVFTVDITGKVTSATGFVKSGGISSQFLKADGSIDANSYATITRLQDSINVLNAKLAAKRDTSFSQNLYYQYPLAAINDSTAVITQGWKDTVAYKVDVWPLTGSPVASSANKYLGYIYADSLIFRVQGLFSGGVFSTNSNAGLGSRSFTDGSGNMTRGNFNTWLGQDAGRGNNYSTGSTYIGENAHATKDSSNNIIVIGADAVATKDNQTVIGTANTVETKLYGTILGGSTGIDTLAKKNDIIAAVDTLATIKELKNISLQLANRDYANDSIAFMDGHLNLWDLYRTGNNVKTLTQLPLDNTTFNFIVDNKTGGSNRVRLRLTTYLSSFTPTVYWGDGDSTVMTGAANYNPAHTFASGSSYIIKVKLTNLANLREFYLNDTTTSIKVVGIYGINLLNSLVVFSSTNTNLTNSIIDTLTYPSTVTSLRLNNNNLTGFNLASGLLPSLNILYLNNNNIASNTQLSLPATLTQLNLRSEVVSGLTWVTSDVNTMLQYIDSKTFNAGAKTLYLEQFNSAPPTGAGLTAKNNLIAEGWTVNTD